MLQNARKYELRKKQHNKKKHMATEYKNIPSYTLKARLYPSKTAQETMRNYIVGLEKAANMTLWALQQHEPLIVDAKEDVNKETGEITTVYWPNFHRMAKAEWLFRHRLCQVPWAGCFCVTSRRCGNHRVSILLTFGLIKKMQRGIM